jgi:hypothetical protein|tara:strand:+ start:2422 stop:2631 length:210 start_codon:yes stop_codon:yes gene_type:complete
MEVDWICRIVGCANDCDVKIIENLVGFEFGQLCVAGIPDGVGVRRFDPKIEVEVALQFEVRPVVEWGAW